MSTQIVFLHYCHVGELLARKNKEGPRNRGFLKCLAKLYVLIFLAAWFTIYYYHNYCDLFIDNVKSGRSRELWVCKELDYDGGRCLRTFITAQNSLERRMVVLYCCHIFVLWCNWNDDLPGCSVLKSKLERLSLCKEINLTKWCIFYSKMSLFICD